MTGAAHQRGLLRRMFDAGVAAVRADACLPTHLPPDRPRGRNVLLAVGKAAGDMAAVAVRHRHFDAGLVIMPDGGLPPGAALPPQIATVFAAHPVPDARSEQAGQRALALARGLTAGDRLVALVSGGGSALIVAPRPPLTLADKMAITQQLLAAGAPIGDINRLRRHLSLIKGGGLAMAAAPADVCTLVLSDIPGDDAALVASGPTCPMAPDDDWRALAARWGVALPAALDARGDRPAPDRPNPAPPRCIGHGGMALDAMAAVAAAAGYAVINLGAAIEGDAQAIARAQAAQALDEAAAGRRTALISGGETSVVVSGQGRGGRNQCYAAALAQALAGHPAICAFAADSDGIDGNSDAAGALVLPDTLARLAALGLDMAQLLAASNSAHGFAQLGDAIVTGPTFTNVNDLRAILVG